MLNILVDDCLIVVFDVLNVIQGLKVVEQIGDVVLFYKIGLGMLIGGGLVLVNELKVEYGKCIFLDMKLFDIGVMVENVVCGLVQFDLDFLIVYGDFYVVKVVKDGVVGKDMKILVVIILMLLDW